jgi:hypothetical protein
LPDGAGLPTPQAIMLDLEGQRMDYNPIIKEVPDFIRALNGDACSLIKEDREVLIAAVKGAPERLTDVASCLAQGRVHLRSQRTSFATRPSEPEIPDRT